MYRDPDLTCVKWITFISNLKALSKFFSLQEVYLSTYFHKILIEKAFFILSGKESSGGNIVYFTFKNRTDCSEGTRLGIWLGMGMGNRRLKR